MSIAEYPNSPYPDRPAMEVIRPFGRFSVGQVYWPASEREDLLRRGLVKYWTPAVEAAPVDRMMRSKRRSKK